MLSPQIDKGILIATDKDEGEEYRSPNQDSGARQEPFDQRDPAQPHQLRAHRSQEKEQGERRQAKQAVHQQVRQESAPHARPVLNSTTVYQQVAQGNILHQALIRRPRKEKRDQRQSDINRHHDQYQARDKAGSLIRQKGLNGLKQALTVPFRRRICFLNHNGFFSSNCSFAQTYIKKIVFASVRAIKNSPGTRTRCRAIRQKSVFV